MRSRGSRDWLALTMSADGVRFYLDEGLPDVIASGLVRLGVSVEPVARGSKDPETIEELSRYGCHGVWITKDMRARVRHRRDILRSGISVAWIRCGNASTLTMAFLVLSFVYRYRGRIGESTAPLYFDVRERVTRGVPSAVVRVSREL